ncbi:MAG TPA: cupin domain-containing protein [Phenylobacterium sp.]|nr:cupin domain-containing protein [Phenylobacterium sp.]
MPKLRLDDIPQTNATGYPPAYAAVVQGRLYRRIGKAAGLSDFGVSHVTLKPGAWSSQRHWHEGEDEFVVVLSGQAVLVDEAGEHHRKRPATIPISICIWTRSRASSERTARASKARSEVGAGYRIETRSRV